MKNTINIFSELNARLQNGVPQQIAELATTQNSWFSTELIDFAVEAIRRTMLQKELLKEWIAKYEQLPHATLNRVLIVMAGNIPLVGFFDLLCVLMAGDHAIVKPSHKDRVLMEWIIGEILDIEPSIPIYIYNEGDSADKIIATGSDMAVAHFEELYKGKPALLRGSRHSAAIITHDTSNAQMQSLSEDIYTYSGLGCRNISLIFVPSDINLSDINIPKPNIELNSKYINNYQQTKAIYQLSGVDFHDTSNSCLVESTEFPSSLSTIAIAHYSSMEEVQDWLNKHDKELQCLVAAPHTINHPRRVTFGEAQYPTLYDYADGIDTMKFLI